MKKKILLIFLILTFVIEIVVSIILLNSKYENNTVKINELTNEINNNFGVDSKYPRDLDYCILNSNGEVVFKNNNETKSINEAYKNSDTIVDLKDNYKLIIKNNINEFIKQRNVALILTISISSAIQLIAFATYYIYLKKNIIKPFDDMKEFANRVAGGNLDIPITMVKGNNFGAFTESFDIMREELKKARIKEKEANDSKKELVAKLSHDIKTPIASIKSTSELGIVMSTDEKVKSYFDTINTKTDQINTLVSNLLTSSVEELTEIKINPVKCDSNILYELIKNSDYKKKVNSCKIEECNIYVDRIRLQQVIDNIFSNSYKYAGTDIDIKSSVDSDYFTLEIKDYGDSVDDMDLPLLTEKYKRGNNAKDKDGVGLGLYISKQFVELMEGLFEIKNDKPGFRVIIKLRII